MALEILLIVVLAFFAIGAFWTAHKEKEENRKLFK